MVKRSRLKKTGAGRKKPTRLKRKFKLQKAIEQTKIAYADSFIKEGMSKKAEEKLYKKRILSWKGTSYLTPDEWYETAKIVGQYNEFEPKLVYHLLKSFEGIGIKLARESSVVIYIKYGENDPKKIEKTMREIGKADEVQIDYAQSKKKHPKYKYYPLVEEKGTMRIWWD